VVKVWFVLWLNIGTGGKENKDNRSLIWLDRVVPSEREIVGGREWVPSMKPVEEGRKKGGRNFFDELYWVESKESGEVLRKGRQAEVFSSVRHKGETRRILLVQSNSIGQTS